MQDASKLLEALLNLLAQQSQVQQSASGKSKQGATAVSWEGTEDQYVALLAELDRAINDPEGFPRLPAAKGIHSFHSGWNAHVRGLGYDPIAFCREAERRGHIHQRPTKGGVVIYPLTDAGRQYLASRQAAKKTPRKTK